MSFHVHKTRLIQIKFNIDINCDELENHMKTYEKKSWSSLVVRSNVEPKYAKYLDRFVPVIMDIVLGQ
jgi:hypothetical protein